MCYFICSAVYLYKVEVTICYVISMSSYINCFVWSWYNTSGIGTDCYFLYFCKGSDVDHGNCIVYT